MKVIAVKRLQISQSQSHAVRASVSTPTHVIPNNAVTLGLLSWTISFALTYLLPLLNKHGNLAEDLKHTRLHQRGRIQENLEPAGTGTTESYLHQDIHWRVSAIFENITCASNVVGVNDLEGLD